MVTGDDATSTDVDTCLPRHFFEKRNTNAGGPILLKVGRIMYSSPVRFMTIVF